jgi:hypothetical protein
MKTVLKRSSIRSIWKQAGIYHNMYVEEMIYGNGRISTTIFSAYSYAANWIEFSIRQKGGK